MSIEEIKEKISKLGTGEYKDGSSVEAGYTYHPIPFEEFKDIPYHKDACVDEWKLLNAIEDFKEKNVLEIGCANGYFSFNMARMGANVTAFEADSDVCSINNLIKNEKCSAGPWGELSFRDDSIVSTIGKEGLTDFDVCLMLNVHMWLVKQHGLETVTGLLKLIAKHCKVLYFQTAHAESSGLYRVETLQNHEDIVAHLKDAGFEFIELISTSQAHGDGIRYMYRAMTVDKVLFQSHKTKVDLLSDGTVVKRHLPPVVKEVENDHTPPSREAKFLLALSHTDKFPQLISVGPSHIRMSYCGEPLTAESIPQDIVKQLSDILLALQTAGINHNDIKPSELCVADGVVRLIDLEWATAEGESLPTGPDAPQDIGGKFRSPAGHSDAFSLLLSLDAIETKS